MSFNWNDHKAGGPPFVTWDEKGDQFAGEIIEIRVKDLPKRDGTSQKTVLLDMKESSTGDLKTLSLGPIDLHQQIGDLEPQVGDRLRVTYLEQERDTRIKRFKVEHKVGERPAVAPAEDEGPWDDAPPGDDSF